MVPLLCRSTPRALAKEWWTVRAGSCLPDINCLQPVLTHGSFYSALIFKHIIRFHYQKKIVDVNYKLIHDVHKRANSFWTIDLSSSHNVRQTALNLNPPPAPDAGLERQECAATALTSLFQSCGGF